VSPTTTSDLPPISSARVSRSALLFESPIPFALGILYGALVAWRRNLRASMIAHAWSDLFEGWLRFL
jgi:hypothetical protein